MTNTNTLKTLINLTSQQSDDIAKQLVIANKTKLEMQHSLGILEDCRCEYIIRREAQQMQGMSVGDYNNFQQFMSNLEQLINQQTQIVQDSINVVKQHHSDWQSSEHKRLSYDTLHKRVELNLQIKENKHDQKQTDEHASQMRTRNQHKGY